MLKRLLAHLPSKLPQGLTDFETWATDIIETYGMPNNDSVKFALAVQILHLPATAAYKPKAYFGHTLIKGAASQVAGQVMQDLKAKQAAEIEAAKQTQGTEATAPTPESVAPDAVQETAKV